MKTFKKSIIALLLICLFSMAVASCSDSAKKKEKEEEQTTLLLLLVLLADANRSTACAQNIAGCSASQFSCAQSNFCYTTLSACRNSRTCGFTEAPMSTYGQETAEAGVPKFF